MTGVSTIGQSLSQIARLGELQLKVSDLSTQLATGKITQRYSGLKGGGLTSQRSRAEYNSLQRYIDNATNADRRIKMTVDTLEEFKKQAEILANGMLNLSKQDAHQKGEIVTYDDPSTATIEETRLGMTEAGADAELSSLQELAGNLFDFLGSLLNSKDGDRFLLGGAETALQPFSDSGLLDSAMSGLINDWKDIGSASNLSTNQLISAVQTNDSSVNSRAVTDTTVGYNASLSSGNTGEVFIRIDDNSEINYSARANESAFRDVMVAIAFIKNENLTPIADVYIPPNEPPANPDINGAPGATLEEQKSNFYAAFDAVGKMLENAINDIDQVSYRLESARNRVNQVKERHQETQNLLLSVISEVEDIDLNEAAIKINQLQVQLDASYRVTARIQQLSLVNFI